MKPTSLVKQVSQLLLGLALSAFAVFADAPNNVLGNISSSVVNNGIQLQWEDTTNFDSSAVDHYKIYVDTHAIGDAESYAETFVTLNNKAEFLVTEFKNAPLVDSQTYYFSITAVNANGEESLNYSNEASFLFLNTEVTASEAVVETLVTESTALVPQVLSAEAKDKNTVVVTFSQEVKLPLAVVDAFTISNQNNELLSVSEMSVDAMTVEISSADQTENDVYTITALSAITNLDGTPVLSGTSDSASFVGSALEKEELHEVAFFEKDETAPEDVTNLAASYILNASQENYTVDLTWDASVNSDDDLESQNFYQKESNTEFGDAVSIDADKTSYQKVLEGGERYTFKISTLDDSGNESTGAITSIILPETGPAAVLLLTLLLAGYATYFVRKRG